MDARSHEGNSLGERTVILHVRSASVIEIFDRDIDVFQLKDETVKFGFKNTRTGERMTAALHYSATVDDYEILREILRNCAIWYTDYCAWEDEKFGLIF